METITAFTWLPVFPGFYGTYFDGDGLYGREIEYIHEHYSEELAKVMVDRLYSSKAHAKLWKEYTESIAKQCISIIWNNLRNLGYVTEIKFEELHSPKEYNFYNDSINVMIIFSAENIEKIKTMLQEHKDEWKEYLKSHYTSCDGFISSHDNYPESEEWQVEKALQDSHNSGALLNFICEENGITDEVLYNSTEENVGLDTEMLKKECIENGWYVPPSFCRDWFKGLFPKIRKNYSFKRNKSFSDTWYSLNTPKQRYIFCVTKEDARNNAFIVKRYFRIFLFGKLKEEKKR